MTDSRYTVRHTSLDGVLLLEPPFHFQDRRGSNTETFHQGALLQAGIEVSFIRDSLSVSRRHVLRGLHGDAETWKLISCMYGSLYVVVVNMDEQSTQYQRWEGFYISSENRHQILVPPKFANGHLVLSETGLFFYKMSHEHDRSKQFTVAWNDPVLNINWPIATPEVSDRDAGKDPTAPVIKLSSNRPS